MGHWEWINCSEKKNEEQQNVTVSIYDFIINSKWSLPRCGPNAIVSNCAAIERRSLSSKTNIFLTEACDDKNFPKRKFNYFYKFQGIMASY